MKKLFFCAAVIAAAVFGVMNATEENKMTDLQMENVEALAGGDTDSDCPNGCLADGDGCYCKIRYNNLKEANK